MIIQPTAREINGLIRSYRNMPVMKEMYEKEAEFLCETRDFEHDYVKNFKIRNFPFLHRGFERIAAVLNLKEQSAKDRLLSWLIERLAAMQGGGWCFGHLRPYGTLEAVVHAPHGVYDLGLISVDKVTDDFAAYLTDALQGIADITLFHFHGSGTDNTGENKNQHNLVAEVDSRVSGNQAEGAQAYIYHTEGSCAYTTTRAIVEHGLFSAITGGTMLDRSIFTQIDVSTSINVLFKYELTSTAEV